MPAPGDVTARALVIFADWPTTTLPGVMTVIVSEVDALSTVCVSVPVPGALALSPLYVAARLWLPTSSADAGTEHVALSAFSATTLQSTLGPSANVTVPVGFAPVTVAVRVTLWP